MSLVRLVDRTSLLSDYEIKALIKGEELKIDPFDQTAIGPTSIDLRLGSKLVTYPPQTIKIGSDKPQIEEVDLNKSYILHPGEFVLGTTLERVYIPNGYQGVIETKGDIARAGIQVHSNDGHIDPGFYGRITLEIVNLHKNSVHIEIASGIRICQLFIGRLSSECESVYKGKYLNQEKPTSYYP